MQLVNGRGIPKRESVSLVTMKTNALAVIPGSGLVLEDTQIILTRAALKLKSEQILETSTSKPWDIYLSSDTLMQFTLLLWIIVK